MSTVKDVLARVAKRYGFKTVESMGKALDLDDWDRHKLWCTLPSEVLGVKPEWIPDCLSQHEQNKFLAYGQAMKFVKRTDAQTVRDRLALLPQLCDTTTRWWYTEPQAYCAFVHKCWPARWKSLNQARSNINSVLGKDLQVDQVWLRKMLSWKNIKRGRDLFIKGMGSFDISQVFASSFGNGADCSVAEMQYRGYFRVYLQTERFAW
jgi:hypothetical protein